jgi:TatD DNase family protein
MKPVFFDTHAHLDFPDYRDDVAAVVQRAEAAGIERIITIGTTLEASVRAVALAERFPNVFAAIGWHPSHVTEAPETLSDDFMRLAQHPKVVALGEMGLDYSRLPSTEGASVDEDERYKARQAALFRQQLEVASRFGLNVIIHQRNSFEDALRIFAPFTSSIRAVFHCFVGTPEERRRINELGCLVSFTGIVTFKNAATIRDTVQATPLGSFMLETDCPFLAPVPYRGKRCEPAYVADIAAFIAKHKNVSLDELSASTCAAARAFFPKLG